MAVMRTIFPALILLTFGFPTLRAFAHEPPPHPSHKIAEKYLGATHLHQWAYAAQMIDGKSLENLKRIQKRLLENAPTIPEEKALLRLLDLDDIFEIDKIDAEEMFIRRAKANTKRLAITETQLAQLQESLKMKTLSTASEGNDMVHALVRVQYVVENRSISELVLVSLIKEGTVWKVSLDAQEPNVVKLKPQEDSDQE